MNVVKAWHNYRAIRKSFGPKGWRGYTRMAWGLALGRGYWLPPDFEGLCCVVCGRCLNLLVDFVQLVDIMGEVKEVGDGYEWHNEDYNLVDEADSPTDYCRSVCLDHHDLTGSPIWDIRTGLAIDVPPQRSRLYYVLRDLGQDILLLGAVIARFVWFLFCSFIGWNFILPIRLIFVQS